VWWRALTGSDETLENAYLMRLAGRFSRRIRGYAKAHDIPVIDCPAGQRKHDLDPLDIPDIPGDRMRRLLGRRPPCRDASELARGTSQSHSRARRACHRRREENCRCGDGGRFLPLGGV
jgi:hypothetical protein